MRGKSMWKFWLCTAAILLACVCRVEASEAAQVLVPVFQTTCGLPQAAALEDVPSGKPVIDLEGLDPMVSAIPTSAGCWPSLGGICVYGSFNCRNDCGARYNTCKSTAGCTEEECYDMRLLCYECCAGWP